jgi:hypothetical protein
VSGGVDTKGYLLNMVRKGNPSAGRTETDSTSDAEPGGPTRMLGSIPFLEEIEGDIGSPERILSGRFSHALCEVLQNLSFKLELKSH